METDSYASGYDPVAGSSEYGSEASGPINGGKCRALLA
jgi:hypothetical protein